MDEIQKQTAQYLLDNCTITVKLMDKENTKARLNVDFKIFKIKGFLVRAKEDGTIWVNPPSYRVGMKYLSVFFSEYPNFWPELHRKLLTSYEATKNGVVESPQNEVDVDNIPF